MDSRYYIAENTVLKRLETDCVYQIETDELYELDHEAFNIMKDCTEQTGCVLGDGEFLDFCLEEKLLGCSYSGPRKISQRSSPVPSLRYLELQLTNRCNLSCAHCYIGTPEKSDLELNTVTGLLEEFESMQGLRLLITGGEPLLYPGFSDLNARLPEYEFRKVLFTNGLLLDKKILGYLNVQEIQISLDGLEASHDLIRGKGTYQKTMRSIEMAMGFGFDVSVSTMIHASNLDDFPTMEKTFRSMGIRDWAVDVPCDAGNLKDNISILPGPDVAGKYLRFGYGNALHGGASGYACGSHLMCIMSDGRAAKCGFYVDSPAGHISEGLEDCWKRIEHMKLQELECDCDEKDVCRGGCRYRAEIYGNRHGKDPYRCAAMGK